MELSSIQAMKGEIKELTFHCIGSLSGQWKYKPVCHHPCHQWEKVTPMGGSQWPPCALVQVSSQGSPGGFGWLNGQLSTAYFECESSFSSRLPDASLMQALLYVTAVLQARHPESIHRTVNRMIRKLVAASRSSAVHDPKHDAKILKGMVHKATLRF